MYKFNFSVVTIEKGRISYSVKAKSKQEAIEKGFKTYLMQIRLIAD